jgi:hypothetical protein
MSREIKIRRLSGGRVELGDVLWSARHGGLVMLTGVMITDILGGPDENRVGTVSVVAEDQRTGQWWVCPTTTLDVGILAQDG